MRKFVTYAKLIATLQEARGIYGNSVLVVNTKGNYAIFSGTGSYRGYIDVVSGNFYQGWEPNVDHAAQSQLPE